MRMLIYLVTMVALITSHTIYFLKYYKLKRDFETLKKDFAVLEISDSELIHAVALPVVDQNTFRYRIYLPPNRKYSVKYMYRSIPVSGASRSKHRCC